MTPFWGGMRLYGQNDFMDIWTFLIQKRSECGFPAKTAGSSQCWKRSALKCMRFGHFVRCCTVPTLRVESEKHSPRTLSQKFSQKCTRECTRKCPRKCPRTGPTGWGGYTPAHWGPPPPILRGNFTGQAIFGQADLLRGDFCMRAGLGVE